MKPETNLFLLKTTRKRAVDAACAACMGCKAAGHRNGFSGRLEAVFRASIKVCTSLGYPIHSW
jgi:hypothetical protein